MDFLKELIDVSVAICFEDEYDDVKILLLELFCKVFGDMAHAVFLSPDMREVPKTVGESLFKPKSHLHSGADVRWNGEIHKVMSWAISRPVPRQTLEAEVPSPPKQEREKKTF